MSYRPREFFVDLVFTITLTVFNVVFHQHFWEIYEHDKDKNKLRHHHVIPMVCTLIEQSSRPISMQEVVQLL